MKVSKGAKIRNRYNQVPHLTQDTNDKLGQSGDMILSSDAYWIGDQHNITRVCPAYMYAMYIDTV